MASVLEIVGERIICYCRKKVAERVVPYTSGHRALEIIIEGRGMTRARCMVIRPWRLAERQAESHRKCLSQTAKTKANAPFFLNRVKKA